jgi:hypothetical protein
LVQPVTGFQVVSVHSMVLFSAMLSAQNHISKLP